MSSSIFDDLIVVKRSGQRVSFNGSKIAVAIKKAFDSVRDKSNEKDINKVYESVLDNIRKNYTGRKTINVEDIQDIIVNELLNLKYNDIYEHYKEYRFQRSVSREMSSIKEQHKFAKATTKLVSIYEDTSYSTPMDVLLNFGKTISLEYANSYLLDSKHLRAHEEGKIFISNLEFYPLGTFNSCHFDFSKAVLENLENIAYLSQEVDGEVSLPCIDYLMESFVISEFKRIYKKILFSYLKLKGIKDYINTLSLEKEIDALSGVNINQNVFNKFILNDGVFKLFEKAYEDSFKSLKERLKKYIKDFIVTLETKSATLNNNKFSISFGTNNSYEGVMVHEIIFDIIESMSLKNVKFIYKIKNINEVNNKVYLLIKTGKIKYLSFINKKVDNYKEEVEYFSNGSLIYDNIFVDKKVSFGRMVVDNVSLNLSVLGLMTRNVKDFYKMLDKHLELCKNALINSFEFKSSKYKSNFKYLFKDNILIDSEKLDDNQKIRKVLKQGTLNIDLIGICECVKSISNDKELELSIEILSYIRKKCNKFSEEEKLNFTVSHINEEYISKSLISIDKSIYGLISGITNKDSYVNIKELFSSMPFDSILDYENKVQNLLNGGYAVEINISRQSSIKDIMDIIEIIKRHKINFVKIKITKKEGTLC